MSVVNSGHFEEHAETRRGRLDRRPIVCILMYTNCRVSGPVHEKARSESGDPCEPVRRRRRERPGNRRHPQCRTPKAKSTDSTSTRKPPGRHARRSPDRARQGCRTSTQTVREVPSYRTKQAQPPREAPNDDMGSLGSPTADQAGDRPVRSRSSCWSMLLAIKRRGARLRIGSTMVQPTVDAWAGHGAISSMKRRRGGWRR